MGGKDLKDTELLPFLRIWFQKNLKIWVPECRFTLRSVEVVKLGYFMPKPVCLKKISSATTHTSSDGVTPELPFWVCFVNSPEMTFCNMGTSVHLSPGKTFVPFFSQKLFFSPPQDICLKLLLVRALCPVVTEATVYSCAHMHAAIPHCSSWSFPWMNVGLVPIGF